MKKVPFITLVQEQNSINGVCSNYYLLKEKGGEKTILESFIIKKIRPILTKNDFYYDVFLQELLELTNHTHHYKLLKIWLSWEEIK